MYFNVINLYVLLLFKVFKRKLKSLTFLKELK